MKVAALCDFPYWEGKIGTAVRYQSLCQSLNKICDLTMVSTVTMEATYADFAHQAGYPVVDHSVLKTLNETLGNPQIPGVPAKHQVSVNSVKHYLESNGFDAVVTPYFNRHWLVQHLSPKIVRIVDTHDCQSQRTRSFARHGLTPTFVMTPETEGRELDKYDIALAMSDEDYAEFSTMSHTPIVTAPFRLPPHPVYRARATANKVLFIAAQSPVNDLTLEYLMREVLPLVPRQLTLYVVGNVTVPEINPLNVTLVTPHNVDDVTWIYGAMDLALNPTYAGGGVKTKTLEAIRYGVPILTTDEGARGMRNLLPDDLVVNDKERFAYMIEALLADPARRDALSQEMRRRLEAEDNESWLSQFAQILQVQIARKQERYAA